MAVVYSDAERALADLGLPWQADFDVGSVSQCANKQTDE